MDWIQAIWDGYYKIHENIDHGIYPYMVPDNNCGWVPAPEQNNSQLNGMVYYADKYGIRCDSSFSSALKRSEGKRKIIFLGDSNIHGDEVEFGETWIEQINGFFPEDQYIINAGVSGHGIDQAYWRLEKLFPVLNPAVAVLAFTAADIIRHVAMLRIFSNPKTGVPFPKPVFGRVKGRYKKIEIPAAGLDDFAEKFTSDDIAVLYEKYDSFYPFHKNTFYEKYIRKKLKEILQIHVGPDSSVLLKKIWMCAEYSFLNFDLISFIFNIFKGYCEKRSIKSVVFFHPIRLNYIKEKKFLVLQEVVKDIAVSCGLTVIDPQSAISDKILDKFQDENTWCEGGHLGVDGSRIYAEKVFPLLKNLF
ncbi:MAG: SGNH/GDSL hydrolase family protein [Planctomycetota bacterium]|jgi:lysophospholipase L1-like esterase